MATGLNTCTYCWCIRISWNHLYQPGIDTFGDLLRGNAVFRLWLYFIYDASGKMPDADSDCYGRAGRRRYDLCGDGKTEQDRHCRRWYIGSIIRTPLAGKRESYPYRRQRMQRADRMSVEVAAKSSGNYTFRLVRVRFYGLLGIGYLTRYVRYEERLSIMPKITPVMIEVGLASRYFQGESEVYDDKTGGDDVSEVFQIRSFQPGDKIQNIHWKLSAKEDELMVRENSQPMGCPVVILLDISGGQKETEKQRNHFFEMVISISFGLVEKQCPHYIAWYDEKEHDLIRVRVDTEEKVYYFILLLYGAVQSREKWILCFYIRRNTGVRQQLQG